MKKSALILIVIVIGIALTGSVSAAADRDGIKSQVDEIVNAINGGKTADDFKEAAKIEPYYVYILEEGGKLLVHPSLEGKNLKEVAMPIYEVVSQATADGKWIQYQWKGKEKNAYVRKTENGMIVGSGY